MLKQRVLTALVLLAVLLPALFADAPWPFSLLTLVLIGAAGWEWARLNGVAGLGAIATGALLVAAGAAALVEGWASSSVRPALWWGAAACWTVLGPLALHAGVAGWPQLPVALRWAVGVAALWTAWLAIACAKAVGTPFILSIFCLVWMADIAAYFGGRAFGKRKLAPSISPGKSWAGAYSGAAGVVLLALVWALLERIGTAPTSLFGWVNQRLGMVGLVITVVYLSAMSVVGDLVESLVKRSAGAKDSSRLLPGHGGVLDRIDALLPVFPVALALATL